MKDLEVSEKDGLIDWASKVISIYFVFVWA